MRDYILNNVSSFVSRSAFGSAYLFELGEGLSVEEVAEAVLHLCKRVNREAYDGDKLRAGFCLGTQVHFMQYADTAVSVFVWADSYTIVAESASKDEYANGMKTRNTSVETGSLEIANDADVLADIRKVWKRARLCDKALGESWEYRRQSVRAQFVGTGKAETFSFDCAADDWNATEKPFVLDEVKVIDQVAPESSELVAGSHEDVLTCSKPRVGAYRNKAYGTMVYFDSEGRLWLHKVDDGQEEWFSTVACEKWERLALTDFTNRFAPVPDTDVPNAIIGDGNALRFGVALSEVDRLAGWKATSTSVFYSISRKCETVSAELVECAAETAEIPEVPPVANDKARVLAVSEAVIPALATFRDLGYSDVSRKRIFKLEQHGKARKVAYVFVSAGVVHVVRRDRYDVARDAKLEAEISAYAAELAQAA